MIRRRPGILTGLGVGLLLLPLVLRAQTIVWQEDWESPAAQDNWYADYGVWEIGLPTYGPPTRSDGWRAHQGTNCAATLLNGSYPENRQSRLVYAGPSGGGVLVPTVEQQPRLRFWHWWSFGNADYGQVQISTNNGASWQALSPGYWNDSSGHWTRGWLDLTPYAGQTALLGLYFSSSSSGGTSAGPGWYVDDMLIETGPQAPFVSPESFEDAGASARWTADLGVWEVGVPTSGPGAAHGGSNCLATILNGSYTENRSSRVSSQAFVVPSASSNPRLRFWHWWSFGNADYGQVQISTNNGACWQALLGCSTDSSGHWTRGFLDLTP